MAGWIKMPLGMDVGVEPNDIMLDGDPAFLSAERGQSLSQFSAHVCCGQTAAWIKMPLGMEIGLGPGHIVRDGDHCFPSPKRGHNHPNFRPVFVVGKRLDGSRCHVVQL